MGFPGDLVKQAWEGQVEGVSVQESTTTLEDDTDDWCGKTGGERVVANGKHIA
jgi:hypothetical protein